MEMLNSNFRHDDEETGVVLVSKPQTKPEVMPQEFHFFMKWVLPVLVVVSIFIQVLIGVMYHPDLMEKLFGP